MFHADFDPFHQRNTDLVIRSYSALPNPQGLSSGMTKASSLWTGETRHRFPTRRDLSWDQYPDITDDFEDFKFGFIKELSERNHWASTNGIIDLYQRNFSPKAKWDVNYHPSLPGIGREGVPEYGRYKNRVVNSSFLRNYLDGLGLGATNHYPEGLIEPKPSPQKPMPRHILDPFVDHAKALLHGYQSWQGEDSWTTPYHQVVQYNASSSVPQADIPVIKGRVEKTGSPSDEPSPPSSPEGEDDGIDWKGLLNQLFKAGLVAMDYYQAVRATPSPKEVAIRYMDSLGPYSQQVLNFKPTPVKLLPQESVSLDDAANLANTLK